MNNSDEDIARTLAIEHPDLHDDTWSFNYIGAVWQWLKMSKKFPERAEDIVKRRNRLIENMEE